MSLDFGAEDVFSSKWFSLRWERHHGGAGGSVEYLRMERPDFVLLVPARIDGGHTIREVALTYRYRPLVGQSFWEFPQARLGAPSANVDEVVANLLASHATQETVGSFVRLPSVLEACGYSSHRCHVVVAPMTDAGDDGRLSWFDLDQLLDGSEPAERIDDAATLAALQRLTGLRELTLGG